MTKKKVIFLVVLMSACICSCYSPRYVYSPPTQNIPLLQKKNDLEFSGFNAGSLNVFHEKGNYNHGIDVQGAWALSDHIALMASESYRWEKNGGNDSFFPNDSSFLSYKRHFTEVGAGYFTSSKYNQKMQFQLFGGAAFGSSDISDNYTSNNIQSIKYHNSGVTKFFIQPSIIYSPVKFFSGALSSRFTAVIFSRIQTNYTSQELNNYILDSLTVSPVFFWEPAVSYTFNFKKLPVKLRFQGSISILLNHRFIEHRTGNIGLGIIADFSKKRIRGAASKS